MEKKFEFTPKQWVLVRDGDTDGDMHEWTLAQFSHFQEYTRNNPYVTCGGLCWQECIPYEDNERLRGTTDEYEPPYEPKDEHPTRARINELTGDIEIAEAGSERVRDSRTVERWKREGDCKGCRFFEGMDENGIGTCKLRGETTADSDDCGFCFKPRMTAQQAAKVLHKYQVWRRGGKEKKCPSFLIGEAIDTSLKILRIVAKIK